MLTIGNSHMIIHMIIHHPSFSRYKSQREALALADALLEAGMNISEAGGHGISKLMQLWPLFKQENMAV